jgi:hypothetical protein
MQTLPDPALSALLRRADPIGPLKPLAPENFAAAVHRRLRSESSTSWWTRLGLARELLPFAAALTLVSALAGGGLAYADQRAHTTTVHAAAYAQSIDPWLMHGPQSVSVR